MPNKPPADKRLTFFTAGSKELSAHKVFPAVLPAGGIYRRIPPEEGRVQPVRAEPSLPENGCGRFDMAEQAILMEANGPAEPEAGETTA